MKTFRFYWLDGRTTDLQGETVEKAFSTAYGGGAIRAIDFYREVPGVGDPETEYKWNPESRLWTPVKSPFLPDEGAE